METKRHSLLQQVISDNQSWLIQDERFINNVVKLLEDDLTVPYIARYKKKETGGIDAEGIRQIQQSLDNHKKVAVKVETVIKKIGPDASAELINNLKQAKTLDEVEELYAPFKKGGKGTLAERARKLGLEQIAMNIVNAPEVDIKFSRQVQPTIDGIGTEKEVIAGVQHILADLVAKNNKIQDKIRQSVDCHNVSIVTKASTKAKELDKNEKFHLYYKFENFTSRLKSYQILAINRAEQLKIVSVKLEIKKQTRDYILRWIKKTWISYNATGHNKQIMMAAVDDSFKRLIEKALFRRMRSRLTKDAEIEAINIFTKNLQHLLLVAPLKNKVLLSIDPGFKNGCKLALIDKNGNLLETAIIYPFNQKSKDIGKTTLISLVKKHSVDVIGLGNGTACRETECFISELIQNGHFHPLQVSYCIVNESGASIYSVTKEAKEEFGNLDPNLISAVSIGRRLQDPLLELVKIEAKHIGVGMYQHDLDSVLLKAAVDGVIEDCVSFVGVDLNACSVVMLRHVAGLSKKQAESIVEYREHKGEFVNRQELLSVKGIGKVTYRNCAGFVRIIPKYKDESCNTFQVEDLTNIKTGKKRKMDSTTSESSKKKKKLSQKSDDFSTELLDQTCIHPESYETAYRLLDFIHSESSMIGSREIKDNIRKILNSNSYEDLAVRFGNDVESVKLILDGLQQSNDYDIRTEFDKPVFKTGLTSINQLQKGQLLTGVVRNTTSFGVFVDIGITSNGLIHSSQLIKGIEIGPGDRVKCLIRNIDINRQRVELNMIEKLSKNVSLR